MSESLSLTFKIEWRERIALSKEWHEWFDHFFRVNQTLSDLLEKVRSFHHVFDSFTVLFPFLCPITNCSHRSLLHRSFLKTDGSDSLSEKSKLIFLSFTHKKRAIRLKTKKFPTLQILCKICRPIFVLSSLFENSAKNEYFILINFNLIINCDVAISSAYIVNLWLCSLVPHQTLPVPEPWQIYEEENIYIYTKYQKACSVPIRLVYSCWVQNVDNFAQQIHISLKISKKFKLKQMWSLFYNLISDHMQHVELRFRKIGPP